jgi:hypothetical protein
MVDSEFEIFSSVSKLWEPVRRAVEASRTKLPYDPALYAFLRGRLDSSP